MLESLNHRTNVYTENLSFSRDQQAATCQSHLPIIKASISPEVSLMEQRLPTLHHLLGLDHQSETKMTPAKHGWRFTWRIYDPSGTSNFKLQHWHWHMLPDIHHHTDRQRQVCCYLVDGFITGVLQAQVDHGVLQRSAHVELQRQIINPLNRDHRVRTWSHIHFL